MKLISLLILTLTVCCTASYAAQSEQATLNDIRIVGRASATITGQNIRLEDIADISSPNIKDDDAVIALKHIVIAASPKPGKSTSINAEQVLSRLTEAKVDLRTTGYTLPKTIQITRASRNVGMEEVRSAIEAALAADHKDLALRSISYREDVQIAPGEATIEAKPFLTQITGQRGFSIQVRVAGEPDTNFRVNAIVDEWREVPVATHAMIRGNVIGPNDVAMARLNAANLPRDTADTMESVVGYAVNNSVGYGEAISKNKLELPAIITAGSKVTLLYRSALLEATATGIALDSAGDGQEIRVRNDGSKKIVVGKVAEPGLVKVIGGQ